MAKSSKTKAPDNPSAGAKKIPVSNGVEPALLELFTDEVMDIYWAENQLVKCLPKMQQAATSKALVKALGDHLELTREHVTRLDQVFALLGQPAKAKKCDAMEGLTKEGEAVIEATEAGTATRDVGIIVASQKVEHYEIAAYGSLTRLAKTLGLDDVAGILAQTLAEEKDSDLLLTSIAEKDINYKASKE